MDRLRRQGTRRSGRCAADAPDTLTTVARFLALLELFREGAVAFDQVAPARRADGPLDRRRGRRGRDRRRVRRRRRSPACPSRPRRDEDRTQEQPTTTTADGPRRRRGRRTLEVAVAELRPALEAVLMVADEPLDHLTLASAVGYPPDEVAAALRRPGRGVRRAGARLRPAQRRRRLAVLHPRGVRPGRGAVRARRAAGPADPGRAGDARGGRLQAAGQPGPGVGDPRGQRRRRDAHAGDARAGRGGRARRGDRARCTGRPATSSSGSGSRRSTELPELAPFLPEMDDMDDLDRTPTWPARSNRMTDRERQTDDEGLVRLQKLLAQSGVASRRKCEELMLAGLVEVDGEVVTRLGTKVDPPHRGDPGRRQAAAAGQRRTSTSCSTSRAAWSPRCPTREGRRTLGDFVADRPERLFHVGRLDTDTEGLILLTNDGDFAQRVAHPSYELDKTYVAEVDGVVDAATVARLWRGVTLDDGRSQVRRCKRGRRARAGPVDRRADHPRGPQPDRAPAARRGRAPGPPADPDRDRAGRAPGSGRARCASSPPTSSARCSTRPLELLTDAASRSTRGRCRSGYVARCVRVRAIRGRPSSRRTPGSTCSSGSPRWSPT